MIGIKRAWRAWKVAPRQRPRSVVRPGHGGPLLIVSTDLNGTGVGLSQGKRVGSGYAVASGGARLEAGQVCPWGRVEDPTSGLPITSRDMSGQPATSRARRCNVQLTSTGTSSKTWARFSRKLRPGLIHFNGELSRVSNRSYT